MAVSVGFEPFPVDLEFEKRPELAWCNDVWSQSAMRSAYGWRRRGLGAFDNTSLTRSAALFRTFGRESRHSCKMVANDCRTSGTSSWERSRARNMALYKDSCDLRGGACAMREGNNGAVSDSKVLRLVCMTAGGTKGETSASK